jgi:hypothetical protein
MSILLIPGPDLTEWYYLNNIVPFDIQVDHARAGLSNQIFSLFLTFACPVKCLHREMQSIFKWGKAYFTRVLS